MKARLYFELGHKLRQTAAINYGVRHSSQVAYNSSLAIFDLFHMLWRWWTLSLLLRRTRDKFDNSYLLREAPTEQSLLVRSRLFSSQWNWRPKNYWSLTQYSALSLVPQPNPAPRVSRVTDVRRCRFDTLGKSTPAHHAGAPTAHGRGACPRAVGESDIIRSPQQQVHPPLGGTLY